MREVLHWYLLVIFLWLFAATGWSAAGRATRHGQNSPGQHAREMGNEWAAQRELPANLEAQAAPESSVDDLPQAQEAEQKLRQRGTRLELQPVGAMLENGQVHDLQQREQAGQFEKLPGRAVHHSPARAMATASTPGNAAQAHPARNAKSARQA
jgi:hypothetical protein